MEEERVDNSSPENVIVARPCKVKRLSSALIDLTKQTDSSLNPSLVAKLKNKLRNLEELLARSRVNCKILGNQENSLFRELQELKATRATLEDRKESSLCSQLQSQVIELQNRAVVIDLRNDMLSRRKSFHETERNALMQEYIGKCREKVKELEPKFLDREEEALNVPLKLMTTFRYHVQKESSLLELIVEHEKKTRLNLRTDLNRMKRLMMELKKPEARKVNEVFLVIEKNKLAEIQSQNAVIDEKLENKSETLIKLDFESTDIVESSIEMQKTLESLEDEKRAINRHIVKNREVIEQNESKIARFESQTSELIEKQLEYHEEKLTSRDKKLQQSVELEKVRELTLKLKDELELLKRETRVAESKRKNAFYQLVTATKNRLPILIEHDSLVYSTKDAKIRHNLEMDVEDLKKKENAEIARQQNLSTAQSNLEKLFRIKNKEKQEVQEKAGKGAETIRRLNDQIGFLLLTKEKLISQNESNLELLLRSDEEVVRLEVEFEKIKHNIVILSRDRKLIETIAMKKLSDCTDIKTLIQQMKKKLEMNQAEETLVDQKLGNVKQSIEECMKTNDKLKSMEKKVHEKLIKTCDLEKQKEGRRTELANRISFHNRDLLNREQSIISLKEKVALNKELRNADTSNLMEGNQRTVKLKASFVYFL
ncbi:hypothetical protein Ciccas_007616 [Cichlidogyrus casuarinus]|uniref:Uncharacterized protein n=1 Tax=Cichlidogyrus casuarinus TaxID=1844966 RepID=A0ABD2Q3I7_9PLAT